MEEDEIIIFGPKDGKSILRSHKELADDPVLKDLSHEDLTFAWLMGIENSPVNHDWPSAQRMRSAASRAFKKDKHKYDQYSKGDIPEEVQLAIKRFSSFVPEARIAAKMVVGKIFNNLAKLADVDVDKDFVLYDKDSQAIGVDWTGRKQYVDTAKTISQTLPELIRQLEDGFGVNEKKSDNTGKKAIDVFHSTEK